MQQIEAEPIVLSQQRGEFRDKVRDLLPDLEAPVDKEGALFFLNQNSREPVTEPDEMVPLWKILHLAGVDWTYGSKGWAAENYCMFLADDDAWKRFVEITVGQAESLGSKVFLNTE